MCQTVATDWTNFPWTRFSMNIQFLYLFICEWCCSIYLRKGRVSRNTYIKLSEVKQRIMNHTPINQWRSPCFLRWPFVRSAGTLPSAGGDCQSFSAMVCISCLLMYICNNKFQTGPSVATQMIKIQFSRFQWFRTVTVANSKWPERYNCKNLTEGNKWQYVLDMFVHAAIMPPIIGIVHPMVVSHLV